MDSPGQKDFLPRTLSFDSLSSMEQCSLTAEPTQTLLDEDDCLEQEHPKLRTFLDTSWSYCDISAPQYKYKGACKSLHCDFNQSAGSEAHSTKSQTLQEQYWACAIPKLPPPRSDRSSPSWNPNKEYQDLLDYCYPLNPKYCLNKEDKTEGLLHDSGVDLGSYSLSCESKLNSSGSPYQEDPKPKPSSLSVPSSLKSPYAFSTPLYKRTGYQNFSEPSNIKSSEDISLYNSEAGFAKEAPTSYSFSRHNVRETFMGRPSGEPLRRSHWFLSSTSVLPLHGDLDTEDDYLSLPPTLKELESLASHLRDLSIGVGQADSINHKQRPRCLSTIGSAMSRATEDDFKDLSYGSELSACQNHNRPDINQFSALRDLLDGGDSSLKGMAERSSMTKENNSLVQRIQKFCLLLDKLIRWLYSVAKITNNWITPKANMESIQQSLGLYLKLKKKVAEQRTLADAIVKDGESLVKSMTANSSVLKDTLSLISKQSEELERHTERLYASVLEAMDTISSKGLGRSSNPKQPVSLEIESS
ncbi:centrosomal protein of 68 kDa [Gastrophryne carolinensis]